MYIYTYICRYICICTRRASDAAFFDEKHSRRSNLWQPKVEPVACVWSFTEAAGNSPTHMRSVSCISRTKAWVRSAVWKVRISFRASSSKRCARRWSGPTLRVLSERASPSLLFASFSIPSKFCATRTVSTAQYSRAVTPRERAARSGHSLLVVTCCGKPISAEGRTCGGGLVASLTQQMRETQFCRQLLSTEATCSRASGKSFKPPAKVLRGPL